MSDFYIEPADVLVFRDGRPFDAGADHLATGPFPPPPSTVYGALRSAVLAHGGADFSNRPHFGLADTEAAAVAGSAEEFGSLTLPALGLARRPHPNDDEVERLFPAPLDLLTRKAGITERSNDAEGANAKNGDAPHGAGGTQDGGAQNNRDRVLLAPRPEVTQRVTSNLPNGLGLLFPTDAHHRDTFYQSTPELLTEAGFARTLAGEAPAREHFVKRSDVYLREPRTQVSLRGDPSAPFTGTAQEGRLFTVDFVRLHTHHGLLVSAEARGLLDEVGLLRLGGESRPAYIEAVPATPPNTDALRRRAAEHGRVKMVLTTPAPFPDGWRPPGIDTADGGDLAGMLGDVAVTLQAVAAGRPTMIGGWDLAAGCPKPTRPAVPAGGVYFLQLRDPDQAEALFNALDGKSLFRADSDDAKQGLGRVRLGVW